MSNLPERTGGAVAAPYVFISYASADRARVLPVAAALRAAGVEVWLDQQGIAGGESYALEIAEAIEHCAALVLCCSAASLASRNVRQEVALAWKYERPYVPVLLEPVTIPKEMEYWLEAAQWVEVLDRPEGQWLPAVLAALAAHGIAPAPAAAETPLAGRERELGLLRDRLAEARAGRGSLVLIGGEAGIGKTTLADAALREAAGQGAAVLVGRCFDLAETPALGPWIDLFARYRADPPLPAPPPAFAERGTVGAVPSQLALFVQVQDFLAALAARSPVVALLDDLHWADPASLDLLRFLTRAVATLPVLVLVTYRSDELTRRHPLYALLPQLARDPAAARLDLHRLDEAAVRALAAGRYALAEADAARLAAYVQGRAEGNALFVGELLRFLEESGALRHQDDAWTLGALDQVAVPPLLRQVIDGRIARLGEEHQRLLVVAAVIGQEVALGTWAAVGQTTEDALLEVTEAAVAARLLDELPGGEGVRFAHALVREALYEGLLATRRRRLHRAAGEALAATQPLAPDAVAYHFQRAGDDRAVAWLQRAGARAEAANAWLTGAARYEAALVLLGDDPMRARERTRLLFRAAWLRRFEDQPRCLAYLDDALALALASGERGLAGQIRLLRGQVRCWRGDITAGLDDMRAGLDALDALVPAERAELESLPQVVSGPGMLIMTLAYAGHFAEAEARATRALAGITAGAPGDASPGAVWVGLALAHTYHGQPAVARESFERARALIRAAGDYFMLAGVTYFMLREFVLRYHADDLAWRTQLAREGEAAYGTLKDDITSVPPRFAWLPLLAVEGDWAGALAIGTAQGRIMREHVVTICAPIAIAQGDRALAAALINELLPRGAATPPGSVAFGDWAAELLRVGAELAITGGDRATARAWLETNDRWLKWAGAVLGQAEGALGWAAYHRAEGDLDVARRYSEAALVHATEPRQPLALLAAHRMLGELDTAAGDFAAARAHLDESLSLADSCAAPYERALTLVAMAELRAATGDRDGARAALDEARAICTPLEAHPALARIAALAERLDSGGG